MPSSTPAVLLENKRTAPVLTFPILKRENDFKKTSFSLTIKSLEKDITRFETPEKTETIPFYKPGLDTLGVRLKKGKSKRYFMTEHSINEYFACEILQYLGINTPKIRLANDKGKTIIASKDLEGFISMSFLTVEGRSPYALNISKQVVVDCTSGKEFKISGNTFGASIAGLIVRDRDFGVLGNNFGLVKRGDRFYAAAIDKDKTKFDGAEFNSIVAEDKAEYNDGLINDLGLTTSRLFNFVEKDQSLIIISRIAQGLHLGVDGLCDFDRIFLNNRVKSTYSLKLEKIPLYCENFKKTARSFIAYYSKLEGDNFLVDLNARENIRRGLAVLIITEICDEYKCDFSNREEFMSVIIEDLRGPYYKHLFSNRSEISTADSANRELINRIKSDITNESVIAGIASTHMKSKPYDTGLTIFKKVKTSTRCILFNKRTGMMAVGAVAGALTGGIGLAVAGAAAGLASEMVMDVARDAEKEKRMSIQR